MDVNKLVDDIVHGAENHASESDELDHTILDLELALRTALLLMSPSQLHNFVHDRDIVIIRNGGIDPADEEEETNNCNDASDFH
jgi:hypothetical protein